VGAVGVAGEVAEAVVLAVGGDPLDNGSLDGGRSEHGEQRAQRASGLEAAVGEQPVVADGDPHDGQQVADGQNDQVLPVQGVAPGEEHCKAQECERDHGHHHVGETIERLVADGEGVLDCVGWHRCRGREASRACKPVRAGRPARR
jgi:hypothetical protein